MKAYSPEPLRAGDRLYPDGLPVASHIRRRERELRERKPSAAGVEAGFAWQAFAAVHGDVTVQEILGDLVAELWELKVAVAELKDGRLRGT